MDSKRCQFCEHGNPADAKYCSECGGCLYLLPCPHCGAVTDVTADTCYQCQGLLHAGTTDGLDPPLTTTEVARHDARYFPSPVSDVALLDTAVTPSPVTVEARPSRRLLTRQIAGTALVAVIAVIAAMGYYGFRQRAAVDASIASSRGVSANTGVIRHDGPSAAASGNVAQPGATAAAPSGVSLAGSMQPAQSAHSAVGEPNTGKQPDVTRETKALVSPVAGTPAIGAGSVSERRPSLPAACTPAVEALGLCATKPVQSKETDADAVINAANARPPSAGKADSHDTARAEACTEVSASLGLCTPISAVPTVPAVTHTQRKE